MLKRPLTLRRLDRRFCIGRFDLKTFATEPCPASTELTDTTDERCHECWLACGFNPAFYNTDKVSPQQREYNSEPHSVYLAYFAKNTIKGGISSRRRLLVRLREQGALCAATLCTLSNAVEARSVEVALIQTGGVLETVRVLTKCKLLAQPFDARAAFKTLSVKAEELRSLGVQIDPNPRIVNLMPDYIGADELKGPLIDVSDKESISGEGAALVGSLLIARQGPFQFIVNLKKYVGHEVALSNTVEPYSGGPIQVGLPF